MEFDYIVCGPGGWPSAPPSLRVGAIRVFLWSPTTRPPRSDLEGVLGRVVGLQSRPGVWWGDGGADGQSCAGESRQVVGG
jgi:hypothetical protein